MAIYFFLARFHIFREVPMAPAVELDGAQYETAGWLQRNLSVSTTSLLRLVALGLVRFRCSHAGYIRYAVEDVKIHFDKEPQYANSRRGRKPAVASST
jgi:hypothetical protein